ncbi:MAG: diguanylate cyclase [Myxococcales bacterium]|nr:diguanylate cyclase [Myxococcales bacterium]
MKLSRAAVLEPNPKLRAQLALALRKAGLWVSAAASPAELSREQLVVLGPGANGPSKLSREIRGRCPRAVVMAAMKRGFRAGFADAVLPLPVSPNDLRARLPELAARTRPPLPAPRPGDGILDPLTNFYTFAHFKEVLFIEVKRARRYGFPLSFALIAFDSLGRELGPEPTSQLMGGLALAIRRSLRDTDFPVQYSPDRVLLLMPHTDLSGALIVSRRICERVAKATLALGDEILRPTISVGVSAGQAGREYAFADLVKQAQESLAAAISEGGNRVEFFDLAEGIALVELQGPKG